MSGSGASRRACWACRDGGNIVVAPNVYFRAEHFGSRATAAIVRKVLRDRMHTWPPLRVDGIVHRFGWFEVVSRQPRLRGSRIGETRSLAATSRMELQPKPARSGTRSRYDGGKSTTSLKTGVLRGKPMGMLAYPTDRMLGGAGPSCSSPRSIGFPVATPGALRKAELVEGRVPFGARITVH